MGKSNKQAKKYVGYGHMSAFEAAKQFMRQSDRMEGFDAYKFYFTTLTKDGRLSEAINADAKLFSLILEAARPTYELLKARTKGIGHKRAIQRHLRFIGISEDKILITPSQIFRLEHEAKKQARKQLAERVFRYEQEEQTLAKLMHQHLKAYRRTFPDVLNEKLPMLSLVPDFLLPGMRMEGISTYHTGVVIEVDGPGHALKAERDARRDWLANELGLHVWSIDAESVKYNKPWVISALKTLKPLAPKTAANLRLQLALWNIATWLSVPEIDRLLGGDHQLEFSLWMLFSARKPDALYKSIKHISKQRLPEERLRVVLEPTSRLAPANVKPASKEHGKVVIKRIAAHLGQNSSPTHAAKSPADKDRILDHAAPAGARAKSDKIQEE